MLKSIKDINNIKVSGIPVLIAWNAVMEAAMMVNPDDVNVLSSDPYKKIHMLVLESKTKRDLQISDMDDVDRNIIYNNRNLNMLIEMARSLGLSPNFSDFV